MVKPSRITKAGAAIIKDGKVLVVKEAGWKGYGIPGGTIKDNENEEECLRREVKEELNSSIKSLSYIGTFEDVAMNEKDKIIEIRLYYVDLDAPPQKTPEIEDMYWFGRSDSMERLGPIDKNHLIPALIERKILY